MTFSKNDDDAKRDHSTGELEAVAAGFSLPLFGGHGPVVLPPRHLSFGHGPVAIDRNRVLHGGHGPVTSFSVY